MVPQPPIFTKFQAQRRRSQSQQELELNAKKRCLNMLKTLKITLTTSFFNMFQPYISPWSHLPDGPTSICHTQSHGWIAAATAGIHRQHGHVGRDAWHGSHVAAGSMWQHGEPQDQRTSRSLTRKGRTRWTLTSSGQTKRLEKNSYNRGLHNDQNQS